MRGTRRQRAVGVVTLLLLAPVTAELLQAYLGDLGGPLGLGFFVLFLAPLYGGACLLVREVCLRTGRGWPGRLLLAAAFGVAMPTLVDRSLFTVDRQDIDGWNDLVAAAGLGGVGWYATVLWVSGHVLMSIAVPTVVAEGLAGDRGPWLGRTGLAVTATGMVAVAALVHSGPEGRVTASTTQYAAAVAIVLGLVLLALTPVGRPLAPRPGARAPRPRTVAVAAFLGLLVVDLTPPGVVGVVVVLAVLGAAGLMLRTWSRAPHWTGRHVAAAAWAALLERTLVGALAPLPNDTTLLEKYTQSGAYLVVVLLLGLLLERATRPGRR